MSDDLSLYVLDAGTIECSDYVVFDPDEPQGVQKNVSVRSYVVKHPDGVLVWDTGMPDALAALPDGQPQMDIFLLRMNQTLAAQLDSIDVDPAAIDILAFSHLHLDHVGNADLFPNAPVLIHADEREAAFGENPERYSMFPDSYASITPDRVQVAGDDHDVFGDGRVLMVALPGHTPGHCGLAVNLPEAGWIFIAGDVAHTRSLFERERVGSFHFDEAQSVDSIRVAKDWVERHDATLWLHHDFEQQAEIATAPHAFR